LAPALQSFSVPGENFLFLVDGKPVITFWGFVNLNENARDDVLECLRESLIPEPEPVQIEDPEPEPTPVITFEQADEPLIAPATVVRITPDELYEPEPTPVIIPPVVEAVSVPVSEPVRKTSRSSVVPAGSRCDRRGGCCATAVAKTCAVIRT
jgi:hypothetical protein